MQPSRRYGWIQDSPDIRDIQFVDYLNATNKPRDSKALQARVGQFEYMLFDAPPPPIVNLKRECPPIYDQESLGSCTANAIAAAIEFERHRQGLERLYPSRLFIYYNERALEDTIDSDAGAQPRDGFKSVNAQGVCSDFRWKYLPDLLEMTPPPSAYDAALHARTLRYLAINRVPQEMTVSLALGFPFCFGISVYESFESEETANTGMVTIPSTSEQYVGGHYVMAVGYDNRRQLIMFRNSWGGDWGSDLGEPSTGRGYGYIPYAYLMNANLADDFWSIRLEEA